MIQAALAYLIVALAFVWVVWRMVLPHKIKSDLIARLRPRR